MAQSAEQRPDLHSAMQSNNPVIATNAAILLSRQHDPETCGPLMKGPIIDANAAIQHPPPIVEPLLRACRSNETNSWQRRAAIEAFSELNHPIAVVELRSLLDQHGSFAGDAARSYQPDLHLELLHGLARAERSVNAPPLGPEGEPRFARALESPAAAVRREALVALANPLSGPLPANIIRYVGDIDSSVRRAALQTLAVRRNPEALELLRQALLDQDLTVRLSAIADLGLLGGPESLKQLRPNGHPRNRIGSCCGRRGASWGRRRSDRTDGDCRQVMASASCVDCNSGSAATTSADGVGRAARRGCEFRHR